MMLVSSLAYSLMQKIEAKYPPEKNDMLNFNGTRDVVSEKIEYFDTM
jgi:hypothetical protein